MAITNIGVIGCGKMSTDLMRRIVQLERGRIAAVCDPGDDASAQAAAEFGSEVVSSFVSLCARPDVEAVMIGSPPAVNGPETVARETDSSG